MKSISVKVLLVIVCIFVLSCCGGGGKNERGTIPEADSNTELKEVEEVIEEVIEEVGEDTSTDKPEEAELEIEGTEEVIVGEEELDILPTDGNSYIAPYDPEMVVENGGIEMVVNQLLMTLNKDETEKVADELAKKVNGIVVGFIYPNTYQIELKTSTIDGLENAIGVIETDSRVQVVVENAIFEAKIASDIESADKEDMWSYKQIKIVEAWKAIKDSGIKLNNNVKIAIVDTGLDKNHPEFKGIKISGINELPGEKLDDYNDNYGHGTNVAGVIAAANDGKGMNGILTGLSNNFELHIYRASNDRGQFSMDAIYSALSHAARNGAKVVNMSFGLSYNCKDERRLTNYDAWKRIMKSYKNIFSQYPDTFFVAAAGNEDINAVFQLPASTPVPNIISVAATDQNDKRSFWGLPYLLYEASNYGNIHIAAPGTRVYTTRSRLGEYEKDNYTYTPGTSISAPFVSGVAVLLFQVDSTLSVIEIKSILVNTADDIEVTYPDGDIEDSKHIWKRLNALNAANFVINRVKSANPEPIPEQPIIEPQLLPIADPVEQEQRQEPDPVILDPEPIIPPPVNHPPVVSNVVVSGTGTRDGGTGDITITFNLADTDGDACNIAVDYQNTKHPYWMGPVEEVSGIAPGTRSVVWHSGNNHCGPDDCKVRVIPSDSKSTGTAGESNWIMIDNRPPNTPPTAKIIGPENNSFLYRGETGVGFTGIGSDAEGGSLSYTWTSDIDGEIEDCCHHPFGASDDDCVLSIGVHTITLTVQDAEGLIGTDSITITIVDKYDTYLAKVELEDEDDKMYYSQNGKFYFVADLDIIKIMADAGLPGWTTYKESYRVDYSTPEFISDGILIREVGTEPVYVVMGNKLRWIRTVEALNWMGNNWEGDIIDVPSDIIFRYAQGNDIFAVGFVETYKNNLDYGDWEGWPGRFSSVLGFPVTEVENALKSGWSGISGTYQTFDNGAIDSSELGTFAVYGAIYAKYKEMKYSGSLLGFPISDEYDWWFDDENCRRSDFEGGYIYWIPSLNETHVEWKGISGVVAGNIVEISDVSPYHVGDEVKIGEVSCTIKGLGCLKADKTYLKLDRDISADTGMAISIMKPADEADSIELIGLSDAADDMLYSKILVDDASVLNINGRKTISEEIVQFTAINGNVITLAKTLELDGRIHNNIFSSMNTVYNYPCYFMWKYDPDDASLDKLNIYLSGLFNFGIQVGDNLLIDEGTDTEEIALVSSVPDEQCYLYRIGITKSLIYSHSIGTVVRNNNETNIASAKLIGAIVEVVDGKGLKKGMMLEISETYLDTARNDGSYYEIQMTYIILWAEDNFIVLDKTYALNGFTTNAEVKVH